MKRKNSNLINIMKSIILGSVSINITKQETEEERIKQRRKKWVNFWMWPLAFITLCIVAGKFFYGIWLGIANPVMNAPNPIEYFLSYSNYWNQRMLHYSEILLQDLVYMLVLLVPALVILKLASIFRYRMK